MGPARRIADRLTAASARRAATRRLAALDPAATLREEIEEWVAEHGDRPALRALDDDRPTTVRDLAGRAARWARWTILHRTGGGEPVGLVMANRPERVAAWLGIAAAGGLAAVLDPGLGGPDLAAAIAAAGAPRLVVDAALLTRFEAAAPHLAVSAAVWVHGPHPMAYPRLDEALDELSPEPLRPADRRPIAATDPALRVVAATGTVVDLDHRSVLRALHAVAAAAGLDRGDRLLLPDLPLASAESVLLPGLALAAGALALLGGDAATAPARTAPLRATGLAVADPPPRPAAAVAPRPRVVVALGDPAAAPPAARLVRWRDGTLAVGAAAPWRIADL